MHFFRGEVQQPLFETRSLSTCPDFAPLLTRAHVPSLNLLNPLTALENIIWEKTSFFNHDGIPSIQASALICASWGGATWRGTLCERSRLPRSRLAVLRRQMETSVRGPRAW